jgi:phosphoadenosine phosphosulfate reductase
MDQWPEEFKNVDTSDAEQLLAAADKKYGERLVLAMSFSMEDIVALDILQRWNSPCRVIALDTGRLPEETFEVADQLQDRFGMSFDWYFPETRSVEELVQIKGSFSFRQSAENRQECCRIRKVEPLKRALKGAEAWITGQRREHSPTRDALSAIEFDGLNPGLLKFNPLVDWSFDNVRQYISREKLPYSALYDEGYVSIGCAPCSRAISPGEDFRAGRWWWEEALQKECGIHFQDGKLVRGGNES